MSGINTNLMSINAQRNQATSSASLATSMQRLSSGLRVNSAKDDAAGLGIAERMNAQVKGMNVAMRNANDGVSMAQTAEGALSKVGDMLQRMRELAVQSRNGTNSADDQDSLNQEFGQLGQEMQRVLAGTTFNGKAILGAQGGTFTIQVGANTGTNDSIDIGLSDMTADASITAVAGTTVASIGSDANAAALKTVIDNIDSAITKINSTRAVLGASQNRFDSVISNLQVSVENQAAARSRIVDADFAQESANLSRAQVLTQAGGAMIAQANQQPQQVMSLLR